MSDESAARLMRPSFVKSFSRAQISSAVATGADFALLFALVEFFGVWYVAAVAAGALVGAVVNFLMNRHWSFAAFHNRWHGQAVRYAITSGLSLVFNSAGVYALTEYGFVHYSVSVFVVSIAVGVLFNFPMHRHFVFR